MKWKYNNIFRKGEHKQILSIKNSRKRKINMKIKVQIILPWDGIEPPQVPPRTCPPTGFAGRFFFNTKSGRFSRKNMNTRIKSSATKENSMEVVSTSLKFKQI
jgi:hypothetical protein